MPIHDLSYSHWAGEWTSHPYRWWVITRQGIALLAKRKLFLVLLFLSLIPFLVRCVMLYVAVVMGKIQVFKVDAGFFENFLSQQLFFTFIISIYAGAGLIANDLKANALQIYLSKAITRRDYLIGKLGVVVFFVALPTLVPALLLFLLAAAFHSDMAFLTEYSWVVLPIVGYSLVIIFTNALIVLAMSSLNRSSRFAGIFFAAIIFFGQIFYHILSGMLRTTPWVCLLVLAAVLAGSVWIVHSRVRAVEVVK
jgi:ABC-2 type transport system permease protein